MQIKVILFILTLFYSISFAEIPSPQDLTYQIKLTLQEAGLVGIDTEADNIEIKLNQKITNSDPAKSINLISSDKITKNFQINIEFNGYSKVVSGTYNEYIDLPMLKLHHSRGEIIAQDDIDEVKTNINLLKKTTIKDKDSLIGKAVKLSIKPYRMIYKNDIIDPFIVFKAGQVNIIYETENLKIRTLGIAQDDGALGATIKVKNSKTGNILSAIIIDQNNVKIIQ